MIAEKINESKAPEPLLKPLKILRHNLLNILQTAEKDNQTEMSIKLTHLKTSLGQLRESINATPDIKRSTSEQLRKIDDLHRQLAIKDAFFQKYKEAQTAEKTPQ